MLAVTLFTFNALVPETYAALLRFADSIWQASLNPLIEGIDELADRAGCRPQIAGLNPSLGCSISGLQYLSTK